MKSLSCFRPISVLIVLCCSNLTLFAQQTIQSAALTESSDGVFIVYGKGMVMYGKSSLSNNGRIPYSRIGGSPFLVQDYRKAKVFDAKGNLLSIVQGKLNLYSHEFYFKNEAGEERVADPGTVHAVAFLDAEEKNVIETYQTGYAVEKINSTGPGNDIFIQHLNQGGVQLLKYTGIQLVVTDSLFGAEKKYYFGPRVVYYLKMGNQPLIKLKKLSKDTVLEALQDNSSATQWIKDQKLALRKEEEVLRFLDWYNQLLNK